MPAWDPPLSTPGPAHGVSGVRSIAPAAGAATGCWPQLLAAQKGAPSSPALLLHTTPSTAASGAASCPGLQPRGVQRSPSSHALNCSIPKPEHPQAPGVSQGIQSILGDPKQQHPRGPQTRTSRPIQSIPRDPKPEHPHPSGHGATREVPPPSLCLHGGAGQDPAAKFQAVWPRDAAPFPALPPENLPERKTTNQSLKADEQEAGDPQPLPKCERWGESLCVPRERGSWQPGSGGTTVGRGRGAARGMNTWVRSQHEPGCRGDGHAPPCRGGCGAALADAHSSPSCFLDIFFKGCISISGCSKGAAAGKNIRPDFPAIFEPFGLRSASGSRP